MTISSIYSVIATKGGVGKTTTTANLGGVLADAGYRVLLVDMDIQPSLSSYYQLEYEAPGGVYELMATSETQRDRIISKTFIDGLDIILSNDPQGQLGEMLLKAPDGRFRLSHLLRQFTEYDIILIDTQGARSITLEAAVLASDHALSPITAELLSAREFVRGTIGMLDELEALTQFTTLEVPPVSMVLNRLDDTHDTRSIVESLRDLYSGEGRIRVMENGFRHLACFKSAGAAGEPIHRFEPKKPYTSRVALAGGDQIKNVATELNPSWQPALEAMPLGGPNG